MERRRPISEWSKEDRDNAMKYMCCVVCGEPRRAKLTRSPGGLIESDLVCSFDESHDAWGEAAFEEAVRRRAYPE
jgi:hypothetical protein